MLNMPYRTPQSVSGAVCSDGETVQWRRVWRRDGLMWLRVSKGVYAGEVVGNFLGCGRLEEYVGVLPALEGRREGVCGLIEGLGGYYGRRERCGFVEVL